MTDKTDLEQQALAGLVLGPVYEDGDFWTAEVQIVGGHDLAAAIYGATEQEAIARRAAMLAFRDAQPGEAVLTPEAFERAPKHHYWGAGEPYCPKDIKAGNGELHTLRCKVCGLDNPRNPICHADKHFAEAERIAALSSPQRRPSRGAVERIAVSFSDKAISLLDIPEESPVLSRIIDEMRVEIAALLPSDYGSRDELERLRAALKPFADAGEYLDLETDAFLGGDKISLYYEDLEIFDGLKFSDFVAAFAALAEPQGEASA